LAGQEGRHQQQEEVKMKFSAENDQLNRKIAEPTSKVSDAPVSNDDMLS